MGWGPSSSGARGSPVREGEHGAWRSAEAVISRRVVPPVQQRMSGPDRERPPRARRARPDRARTGAGRRADGEGPRRGDRGHCRAGGKAPRSPVECCSGRSPCACRSRWPSRGSAPQSFHAALDPARRPRPSAGPRRHHGRNTCPLTRWSSGDCPRARGLIGCRLREAVVELVALDPGNGAGFPGWVVCGVPCAVGRGARQGVVGAAGGRWRGSRRSSRRARPSSAGSTSRSSRRCSVPERAESRGRASHERWSALHDAHAVACAGPRPRTEPRTQWPRGLGRRLDHDRPRRREPGPRRPLSRSCAAARRARPPRPVRPSGRWDQMTLR
jgi:hypothetical protein